MNVLRKIITVGLFAMTLTLISDNLPAQGPPPPPGDGGKGTSSNQSAPIDGGLSVMMLFATGAIAREWYKNRRKSVV